MCSWRAVNMLVKEVSPAHDFWETSHILVFRKSTNWLKRPKKLLSATKMLKKLLKIAQTFYILVKSTQKISRKAPDFVVVVEIAQNFSLFVKSTQKKLLKSSQTLLVMGNLYAVGVQVIYSRCAGDIRARCRT